MPKYSVKKPFTILVAVILVLVLGFVSLTGIQTDLLPAMNLPYLMVITTYPGASPEQVEADVTKPLENALSTLNGVKNVTSQSNENYSLLFLEYQDDTDMDSAMVKASTAVNQLGDALPDMASTPTLMEISPDMMATQYIAVDYDGMDIYELSDYVSENVLPQLERVDGVASVSTTGLVEKSVQITLDQEKIDAVNDKLLVKVSDRLADAKKSWMPTRKNQRWHEGTGRRPGPAGRRQGPAEQPEGRRDDPAARCHHRAGQADPRAGKKIASLQTDLDEANRKLENAKNTSTTLPEVTLPIDDALFASCKTVLAAYDPQYNADALPANLAEAKSDLNKMGAMVNSIDRADAAIRQRAADEGLLEQNMTVEQTAAYLDAQYAAMSARIQALEVEIASLQDSLNNTEDETERADLQAQIDAKRAEQAQDQAVIDGNAARRARVSELSGNLSTLSTTKVALQNATTLLTARQEAETALNDGMQPLQQTLNDTAAALRDQLTKAQEMLTQLNEQRDKLQKCWQALATRR
ncbi:efflux RND transporter permease subunit [Gemmiger formicilis]|nr:efflux RND transporter permease subunit [Gemmiger formicilis]